MNTELAALKLKRTFIVTTGIRHNAATFKTVLEGRGIHITSKALDLMSMTGHPRVRFGEKKEGVILADVSVEELGLPDNAPYGDICLKAIGHSVIWAGNTYKLAYTSFEQACALREQYTDQPFDEWLRVGMFAIQHPMGNRMLLRIVHGRNKVLYFDTDDGGDLDDLFDGHVRFIWQLTPVPKRLMPEPS
ncbi:MAG: hypothetical protein AAB511_00635 [Patescibacteria group bacterium]